MNKDRLEAFSDGMIAIIITIMVLELKVPHGVRFAALEPVVPVLLSYILSFIYVHCHDNCASSAYPARRARRLLLNCPPGIPGL